MKPPNKLKLTQETLRLLNDPEIRQATASSNCISVRTPADPFCIPKN